MAYEGYEGRVRGRILYFLYRYTFKADTFKIIDGKIYESNETTLVATYTWDGDSDVPTFKFVGDYKCLDTIQKSLKSLLTGEEKFDVGMFWGGKKKVLAGASSERHL